MFILNKYNLIEDSNLKKPQFFALFYGIAIKVYAHVTVQLEKNAA